MTSRRKKIVIILVVVVALGALIAGQVGSGPRSTPVRIEAVESRDLVATVIASGKIEPERAVDIASDITGRIIYMPVDEGQFVTQGQLLLRIDPTQFQATVAQAEASLSSARASELQAVTNRDQAKRNLDRAVELRRMDSNTEEQLETASSTYEVAVAVAEAQGHQVRQAEARLREANEQLSKTTLISPMDGQITRLAVEEGEVALAGRSPGRTCLPGPPRPLPPPTG